MRHTPQAHRVTSQIPHDARPARSHRAGAIAVASIATLAATVGAAVGPESPASKPAAPPTPTTQRSIAVVELFTSEGCSSCPPAERVLSDLLAREWAGDVIALAFHVDYWDNLGWPDRFASPEATARQRDYARRFDLASIYTPQMIVNGSSEFVGADRAKASAAIKASLATPPTLRVSANADAGANASADAGDGAAKVPPAKAPPASDPPSKPEPWTINVTAEGAPLAEGAVVLVAQIESGLVVKVDRGENAGRTLTHDATVVAFASAPLAEHRAAVVLTPSRVRGTRSSLAVVVQDKDRRVLGATTLATPAPAAKE